MGLTGMDEGVIQEWIDDRMMITDCVCVFQSSSWLPPPLLYEQKRGIPAALSAHGGIIYIISIRWWGTLLSKPTPVSVDARCRDFAVCCEQ